MTKKVFERSYILGALMAFVITGSALAAELNINSDAMYNDWKDGGIKDWTLDSYRAISYEGADKNNNSVIFSYDGNYEGLLAVITSAGKNAEGNNLTIDIGMYKGASLEANAAFLINGKASNNNFVINGGSFEYGKMGIYGVSSNASDAIMENNVLNINGGIFNTTTAKSDLAAAAGFSENGEDCVVSNKLNITSNSGNIPEFNGNLWVTGGYSHRYNAYSNKVDVEAGVFNGVTDIHGGRGEGGVENNEVIIRNAIFNNEVNIYGGYDKVITTGEANNNVVTIGKDVNFNGTSNIYGANRVGVGNALNITDGWNGKVTAIKNFNTININDNSKIEVTGSVELPKGATLNLADGNDYTGDNYAITGKLTTDETAALTIGNIKATTYNIATAYTDNGTAWTVDILNDELLLLDKINTDGKLQVTVKAQDSKNIAENLNVSEGTADVIAGIVTNAAGVEEGSAGAAAVGFINNVMSNAEDKGTAINSAMKMAEHVGISANAAKIMTNVGNITNDRLSFTCGHSAPNKGGYGVGLFEEGSGADIWAEYVHGKDKVEDMPSTAGATSYEGQFNGIVMGVDFKKVNKFQSGVAFNYGEGDTNSAGNVARTRNDYDFWGVGYYGNIHNDDSNVIFDVNYAKTDSDVTQNNSGTVFEASPETTTWSAGVKLEKLYQNENVQIVPYTGLRYMSIDSDDYSTKCGAFNYSMDRQDIWLLPLGVSIRQEIANDNGWTVSPRIDLAYIWAFGDTNSNMEVKSPFSGVSQLGYDVMDDGSFLGLVGIEAHKGQWGYGVSYSYQKGDHSESKKWFVDVNYSF